MAKMTLAHARKMRDGVLKGDSVIAQAWKELISGEAATEAPSPASSASPSGERGSHTAASLKAQAESW